jgi:pimeloyl-ACP methyl ester carboxylesterase
MLPGDNSCGRGDPHGSRVQYESPDLRRTSEQLWSVPDSYSPGETPGAWWANTGSTEARLAAAKQGGYSTELDPEVYFLHDGAAEVLATGDGERPEAAVVFEAVCCFESWQTVPIRVVAGADDRLFPIDFQRTLARDCLNVDADALPGGHLIALVHPAELATYLLEI